jgi:hypothetical protein
MAAIIPPAGLAPGNTIITAPLAAPAQMTTFTEYFTDASEDKHNHHYYASVMSVFASISGGPQSAQILELVINNLRESSLGYTSLRTTSIHKPTHQGRSLLSTP